MMARFMLIVWVLLVVTNVVQQSVVAVSYGEKITLENRLLQLNKPAIKSYLTKYGDILDCVEIYKQLAFDHPLLKNHSLQMKPTFNVPKQTLTAASSTILKSSDVLPKNFRCPRGTVPIKRLQKEDIAMDTIPNVFATDFSTNDSSKSANSNDDSVYTDALLLAMTNNIGVSGRVNVWDPKVSPEQRSQANVFVASGVGSLANGIISGWMVFPYYYKNFSRLFTYWTKDNGKTTGCYNIVCPGFMQVSEKVPIGQILSPVSTYGGVQYDIGITIQQDEKTKNWWLIINDEEHVGYWPKEIFSTLAIGATRAGWGGEVYSPPKKPTPPMGSGHFPEEGYRKACFIFGLNVINQGFPSDKDLRYVTNKPDCYNFQYGFTSTPLYGHIMYFGGPPNCNE